jgi:hypothetical protein
MYICICVVLHCIYIHLAHGNCTNKEPNETNHEADRGFRESIDIGRGMAKKAGLSRLTHVFSRSNYGLENGFISR